MNILLTGASGFIGKHLSDSLIEQGHTIIACSHQKKTPAYSNPNQQYQINFMQMRKPEDWLSYLNNVDVVINTVGIIAETKSNTFEQLHTLAPISLFKACEQAGVKRVIQISALGADETAIVPYHISKKNADDALRKTKLDWFVLRPSLVMGEGGASFSFFKKLSNLPVILLFSKGEQLIQPINIKELIATVLRCLDKDVETKQSIDLVGKKAISYKNWMKSLRTQQTSAYFLSVPISVMMQISKTGKYINIPLLNPDSIMMLQQNNVADSHGLELFLNRRY